MPKVPINPPVFKTPPPTGSAITSLSDFLAVSEKWHHDHLRAHGGILSDLWYRGVNRRFDFQAPGVYRPNFTNRAKTVHVKDGIEGKRLRLERDVLSQFRGAGAVFLEAFSKTQIYFTAQHFGLPTRLLDWSTNPLASLFFACESEDDKDGFIYAMDAKEIAADDSGVRPGDPLYRQVLTMRHSVVEYAVGISFWDRIDTKFTPRVLAVRPDVIPGRIGQQSSVFTLHMHRAEQVENPTLITWKVDAKSKPSLRDELHRVNINQFTTYYDLDHLSKEIKRGWGL